jgi:hypothetical protein
MGVKMDESILASYVYEIARDTSSYLKMERLEKMTLESKFCLFDIKV